MLRYGGLVQSGLSLVGDRGQETGYWHGDGGRVERKVAEVGSGVALSGLLRTVIQTRPQTIIFFPDLPFFSESL
jgi:hypothetical protein